MSDTTTTGPPLRTTEVPIRGMDCAGCARSVHDAIAALPGVTAVEILLSAEKAIVRGDARRVAVDDIRRAVERAGYTVPPVPATEHAGATEVVPLSGHADLARRALGLFGIVFGAVLFAIVVGEWLGLFAALTRRVPFPLGVGLVLLAGYPVFRNVIRATLQRRVIAHTLMSVGVLAALAVGQWATAAVVVFLMRAGDYAEGFTTERGRRALRDLAALAPQTARVERDGAAAGGCRMSHRGMRAAR